MLENIPDFQYFIRHSYQIHNDKDSGKDISVKQIDLDPSVNECQVIKIPSSLNDLPPIVHTDLTIERGTVTKKSYVKPRIHQLEGKHKVVYQTRKDNVFVVVRTDKYPLLWLYYWIALRMEYSRREAQLIVQTIFEEWEIECRSMLELVRLTIQLVGSFAVNIWREWTR